MIIFIILWLIIIVPTTYYIDKIYPNYYPDKTTDTYHFIIFSFLLTSSFFLILYPRLSKQQQQDLVEAYFWIVFITLMSSCCRNSIGRDVNEPHFAMFSFLMLYYSFIFRSIKPKEEKFLELKIFLISLVVLKILWPALCYCWPFWPLY